MAPWRRPGGPITGRAWMITFGIGVTLLVATATVFVITTVTANVAEESRNLHDLDETYRLATVIRADAGFALHLDAMQRLLDMNLQTPIDSSVAAMTNAHGQLDGLLAQFDADRLPATRRLAATSRDVVAELGSYDERSQHEAEEQLLAAFQTAVTELEAERRAVFERLREIDSTSALWSNLARFAVALVVPLGLVLAFRELVMRQYRQRELEISLEAEQELAKARDELVANTSHELRTPLTAIAGLGQVLEEDARLPEDVREMLRLMNSESADLTRMVEDLLTTARLAAGQLRFEPRAVDTEEEAETVVRPFLQNGHQVDFDVELASVWVDRLRLRQVLRNLISNAVKYGGDNIQVRGFAAGDVYEWMVVDNGPGVPKELEERLFQRYVHSLTFQQAVVGGVGLGLSIVKSLVEGMGGSVDYRRVLGETIFVVRVPRAQSIDVTDDATDQLVEAASP